MISLIGLIQSANALDTELHGFADARVGARTRKQPTEEDRSLTETRLQLDLLTYLDRATIAARADLVYDDLADDGEKVDLENGDGFIDLRELNILFTPVDIMDVKVGRQILTWGTGDLLFINDLFPKDWNSFLLGRDEEYLKAPSDAIFASLFPAIGSIDIAYTPRMDADRYVDGRRLSYWNPMAQSITGQNAVMDADRQDRWFRDQEIAVRFYRPLLSYEAALYAYHGYWKSPSGFNPVAGQAYFPHLNAYGASLRGTLGSALVNAEAGYYDSRQDRNGTNPFIPNSEVRFMTGYEREVAKNLTAGMQYYMEWMMNYDAYEDNLLTPADTARDEVRHVLSLRLTKMMMNQNLILGLFTFYSPSDNDFYLRPNATYKLNDHWMLTANGNIFVGENDHTFFGQFEDNSNLNLGVRYSF
ncbi:MAG: hypothetical protein JXR25_02950 [Pontiellaceae bacterium]|nr:hypothetical protein [Pontiellaceae bacterium]MBN2783761.1 hypothetical protein [Pontiellaceae bacterium]